MASVSHKGAISFGLVHIPVALYTATREGGISFNQLHRETHERIHYKKVTDSGEEVKPEDIVKGYEYEKGKYVVLTDEEIESMKTEQDKTIKILLFSDRDDIDTIYYEKAYYAIPDGSDKAFELLRRAMLDAGKIAIASTVMGTKETLMALVPTRSGILAETMFYADEIKPMPKAYTQSEPEQSEMEVAKMLIDTMTKPFEAGNYRDEYQARLQEAIARKINGDTVTVPEKPHDNNVINLMDALKASLEAQKREGA